MTTMAVYENVRQEDLIARAARIEAAANAYIAERLAHVSDPMLAAKLLIGDRDFMILCMCGFASKMVAEQMTKLMELAA